MEEEDVWKIKPTVQRLNDGNANTKFSLSPLLTGDVLQRW